MEQEFHRLEDTNAELQQQLAKTRSTAGKLGLQARSLGHLDWEAEKRRILAALEADVDGDDAAQGHERLKMQQVVETTGKIIAAKDREIHELRERLEAESRDAVAGASGTVSVEQMTANGAALREEQEKLKLLQAPWQEKIRQAEVELALERARIARQQAELGRARPHGRGHSAYAAHGGRSRGGSQAVARQPLDGPAGTHRCRSRAGAAG